MVSYGGLKVGEGLLGTPAPSRHPLREDFRCKGKEMEGVQKQMGSRSSQCYFQAQNSKTISVLFKLSILW